MAVQIYSQLSYQGGFESYQILQWFGKEKQNQFPKDLKFHEIAYIFNTNLSDPGTFSHTISAF